MDLSPVPARVPVLWITGPGGVGKSTVAWQLYGEVAGAGVPVAFADADQLCMCYPAPAADPGREELKARNFGTLVPLYRAAGAACVIANGVVDPRRGVLTGLMPAADVTVCRLRAGRADIGRRLAGRLGPEADAADVIAQSLDEADLFDAGGGVDVCVDTTGVRPAAVAGLVRDACAGWPGFAGTRPFVADPRAGQAVGGAGQAAGGASQAAGGTVEGGGDVLLICGPRGVGKSTIGFNVYMRSIHAGHRSGYVDLRQLGFVRPEPASDPGLHRLRPAGLAAMWRAYREAGATRLVATGPIDSASALAMCESELAGARVTVCRLQTDPAELTRRIMSRGDGGSWPEPGDELRGQPAARLRQVAADALAAEAKLAGEGIDALTVDVGHLGPDEAAGLIATAAGWP